MCGHENITPYNKKKGEQKYWIVTLRMHVESFIGIIVILSTTAFASNSTFDRVYITVVCIVFLVGLVVSITNTDDTTRTRERLLTTTHSGLVIMLVVSVVVVRSLTTLIGILFIVFMLLMTRVAARTAHMRQCFYYHIPGYAEYASSDDRLTAWQKAFVSLPVWKPFGGWTSFMFLCTVCTLICRIVVLSIE